MLGGVGLSRTIFKIERKPFNRALSGERKPFNRALSGFFRYIIYDEKWILLT